MSRGWFEMKLRVNGKEELAEDNIALLDYLLAKGINPAAVVVEHNYEVPKRENWKRLILKDNDNLEIVKFIGGG
jgi:sulfur carrier protein